MPRQQRHRARVHRVAAQLVARERRAIEDRHANAGAREHERGDGAGRPAADDEDVSRMTGVVGSQVSGLRYRITVTAVPRYSSLVARNS